MSWLELPDFVRRETAHLPEPRLRSLRYHLVRREKCLSEIPEEESDVLFVATIVPSKGPEQPFQFPDSVEDIRQRADAIFEGGVSETGWMSEGLVCYKDRDHSTGVLVARWGEVELFSWRVTAPSEGEGGNIIPEWIEQWIIELVPFAEWTWNQGNSTPEGPPQLDVSLSNVKGRSLLLPQGMRATERPIDRPHIHHHLSIPDGDEAVERVSPILDALWQSGGWDESMYH